MCCRDKLPEDEVGTAWEWDRNSLRMGQEQPGNEAGRNEG